MEVVDVFMEGPSPDSQVLRCIQVGLLCVQLRSEDRPSMSSVLVMLFSDTPMLPPPKQPGFYTARYTAGTDSSPTVEQPYTPNEVTVTWSQGR